MINITNTQDDLRGGFIFKNDFSDLLKMLEYESRNSNSQESQL